MEDLVEEWRTGRSQMKATQRLRSAPAASSAVAIGLDGDDEDPSKAHTYVLSLYLAQLPNGKGEPGRGGLLSDLLSSQYLSPVDRY